MSASKLANVSNQIRTFWSDLAMEELRFSTLLPGLVNKDYEGAIEKTGDTVKIMQVNAPAGELRTVGTDADSFATDSLSMSSVSLTADKRAVAAYEIEDLVQLQSQIEIEQAGGEASPIRKALVYAVQKKISDYLFSLVVPSTSAPDHLRTSISAYDATEIAAVRLLAAQAKWGKDKPWWILADPSYYSDILAAATLTSKDYVGDEAPVVGGQIVNKRFGFNILEDNSLATDQAVAFHPDAILLAMQKSMTFKLSDMHAQKKFGWVLSADVVFGAKLGIDGSKKCILSTAGSNTSPTLAV